MVIKMVGAEYSVKYEMPVGEDIIKAFKAPSLQKAIEMVAVKSFTKMKTIWKYDNSAYYGYPVEFTVYKDGKMVAHYNRQDGNQDKIRVYSDAYHITSVAVPYGSGFKLGYVFVNDGWVKRPTLLPKVYPTMRDARAGAYALIKEIRKKNPSKNENYVRVEVYSTTMFPGKNTPVGSVAFNSDYDWGAGGFMWEPLDCGDAYYIPGVNAKGGLTREIYRTT